MIQEKKNELINSLKQNFKFINGISVSYVRDIKGAIPNKEWRLESNLNKKILKPTETLTTC